MVLKNLQGSNGEADTENRLFFLFENLHILFPFFQPIEFYLYSIFHLC